MPVEFFRRALGNGLAILHHHDAVAGSENVAEQMRNQDHARALCHLASDKSQKLLGGDRVERGGRLIEDDEAQRDVGHREGAGNFRHLALADGQIGNGVIGADAMAGENLVKLCQGKILAPLFPAKALQAAMHDPDIFGNGQIGAEGKLLEDAADAVGAGDIDRPVALMPWRHRR